MATYPVYRLVGGEIMYQEQPGGRWTSVDRQVVEEMLKAYEGVPQKKLYSKAQQLATAKSLDE